MREIRTLIQWIGAPKCQAQQGIEVFPKFNFGDGPVRAHAVFISSHQRRQDRPVGKKEEVRLMSNDRQNSLLRAQSDACDVVEKPKTKSDTRESLTPARRPRKSDARETPARRPRKSDARDEELEEI
jgi:hypothetical protein